MRITQATTQVNNAKNGLNGAENLRNAQNTAKQNLNTLSHLTNNQKSAISSQIDRAGHVSEVTAAKNAATRVKTRKWATWNKLSMIKTQLNKVLTSLMQIKPNVMRIQMR